MRRSSCFLLAGLTLLFAASLHAQNVPNDRFSVNHYVPAIGPGNYVQLDGAALGGHLAPSAELWLDYAPVILGSGESIFTDVAEFDFEPVEVLHSPLATHIGYRRVS